MMDRLRSLQASLGCWMLCLLVSSVTNAYADDTVRLINTFDNELNKGRVEVYYAEAWGTICDDDWDINDADVVCRQLGYQGALRALPRAYFGSGYNLIWLDNVNCNGDESRIQDCPSTGWGSTDCVHKEDASVECTSATVRLTEGPDRYEGNVQLLNNGEWGYVCDNEWDQQDGAVVCRQIDNEQVNGTKTNSYYGNEPGNIWVDEVKCSGNEAQLEQCPSRVIGNLSNACSIYDKAGVRCYKDIEDGTLRLVGTSDANRGRVEIYHNGEWGTVCDDSWDYYDAKVVCRQLGYTNSQPKAYYKSYYGAGSGRIWLDNVVCYGTEARLENCISSDWGSHDCSHSEDAGVYCDLKGEFDAAEITGIVMAVLFGLSIMFCCVKYICCESAVSKRQQRRRRRTNTRQPARTTTNNTPEAHFDAHFNDAFTISGDDVHAPQGIAYPPPFPTNEVPPFTMTDLPPAYEYVISISGTNGTSGAAGAAGPGSAVDPSGAVPLASTVTPPAAALTNPSLLPPIENPVSPSPLPAPYPPAGSTQFSGPASPPSYQPPQTLPDHHVPKQTTNVPEQYAHEIKEVRAPSNISADPMALGGSSATLDPVPVQIDLEREAYDGHL